MQPSTPSYPDYLLKQARENRRLTVQQVAAKTGITKKKYEQIEAGDGIIDTADAELLGALFKIKPQYIKAHSRQLQLLYVQEEIAVMYRKKIVTLARALKRKIKTGSHANRIHY